MEKIRNYFKDFFEYDEIKQLKDIQSHNFNKYKKSFCDLECNENMIFQ